MKKRVCTMLVALALLLTLLPTAAFAAGNVAKVGNTEYATIDEAIANWGPNTTLTLLADVTLSDVVKLKSTEHHILNLGTYTLTAASGKNAIEITCEGRSSASYALTINADKDNPGGINAPEQACIYYRKLLSTKDRPIITINGGIFNGAYSINSSSSNGGTNCPQFVFNGGTFNAFMNLSKAMMRTYGGLFNCSINCTGDVSAYRLFAGGTFKSFQFLTSGPSNNEEKLTFGKEKNKFNCGLYVDDNGYLVVGGDVITEPGDRFEASASYSSWNSWLQYSSAKTHGLYYTSLEQAMKKSNAVTVYVDSVDMTGSNYKGTLLLPKEDSRLTVTFAAGTTPTWKVSTELDGKIAVYTESTAMGGSGSVTTRIYTVADEPTEYIAPVAKTGLAHTGQAQELVTAGSVQPTAYNMLYAVCRSKTTAPSEGWSTAIPTAVEGGTHYVWYKLSADTDVEKYKPKNVEVIIGQASPNYAVTIEDWLNGQTPSTPEITAPAGVPYTVYYEGTGETVYARTTDVPAEDGTYKVVVVFDSNANYYGGEAEDTFTITTPVSAVKMYWPELVTGEGGTVKAAPLAGAEGTKMTLIIQADEGKQLDVLRAYDAAGDPVELTEENGRWSFVQPAADVTVVTTFSRVCPAEAFSDLDLDAWHHAAVDYVLEEGLMIGTGSGRFEPDGTLDRAQVLTVLWRLEGSPDVGVNLYTDVPSDEWYTQAVAWATEQGLALGHGDGTFGPGDPVTLEQLAAFLHRYEQFKDGKIAQTSLESAMAWTKRTGMLDGMADITTEDAPALRSQIAWMLMKALNN